MSTSSALLVAWIASLSGVGSPEAPPDSFSVTLEAEHPTYHVGQAVRLTLRFRNDGTQPLYGHFGLTPDLPPESRFGRLLQCRNGDCREYQRWRPEERRDYLLPVQTLQPGREYPSSFVIALDEASIPVLDTPGEQDFRWVAWAVHRNKDRANERGVEVTATARIQVLPVPPTEVDAYAFYRHAGLADLALFDARSTPWQGAERLRSAEAFLEEYGASMYAEPVRQGLVAFVRWRAGGRPLTPDDQRLLDRFGGATR